MRRIDSRFVALTAAILFAADTPTLHYANKILTEHSSPRSSSWSLLSCVTARKLPLAGILTGVLVLIRPVAIAYFVAVVLCLALRRARARDRGVVLLSSCRSDGGRLHHTGVLTISSIGGMNLLTLSRCGRPGHRG